jgi:8-amino-7-oxononanoate synthase
MRLRASTPEGVETASSVRASELVRSAPWLHDRLCAFLEVGLAHGALYDRQNLGPAAPHVSLGPPGRGEISLPDMPGTLAINLAANSYLGLADDPRVANAVRQALAEHGTHTGGSRLLCGTARIHWALEKRLAEFFRARSVVTYSSGYAANVSVISSLFGPGDLIILDRHAHQSLYDGAMLAGATVRRFGHNDVDRLDLVLSRSTDFARRLVCVDGVYSMDGHVAPLPEILHVTRRHGAFLLVDDAHAIGVIGSTGRGTFEHFNMDPDTIDIRIGTLSKAIPSVGGFAAVSPDVAVILRYGSHGTLFSAALTPLDAAAALAGVDILADEPERVSRLTRNAGLFRELLQREGLDTLGSQTAIVPVHVGDRWRTLEIGSELLRRGVFVNPVIYPGIRQGAERLRCFVSARHAEGDLRQAARLISDVMKAVSSRVLVRVR